MGIQDNPDVEIFVKIIKPKEYWYLKVLMGRPVPITNKKQVHITIRISY